MTEIVDRDPELTGLIDLSTDVQLHLANVYSKCFDTLNNYAVQRSVKLAYLPPPELTPCSYNDETAGQLPTAGR